jgi:flavin-dependent dehydrogenase
MPRDAVGLHLSPGSRVAIVGGGPAGSFTAFHLLQFAREAGVPLSVTVFERKDFRRRGQTGCNKCAGILSPRLVRALEAVSLSIPSRLVMAQPTSYVLHLASEPVEIVQPGPDRGVLSVYRGGGPLRAELSPDVSFDAWLLDQTRAAGAEVVSANVRRINAGSGTPKGQQPVEVEVEGHKLAFDLIVLAIGVNAQLPALEGSAYQSPRTAVMAQDELALGTGVSPARRNQVQIHFGPRDGLLFGAVTPKGELFNASLLGHDLAGDPVGALLRRPEYAPLLEGGLSRLCGCHPRVAVSPARGIFSDRFVAVGDAAVTRLYKDGIGSAFFTARQAAWTAVNLGIGSQDFARGYASLCRSIAMDNRVGALLFGIWERVQAHSFWASTWLRVLSAERSLPVERRRSHLALWDLLTGADSYAGIAKRLLRPDALGTVLVGLLSESRLAQRFGLLAGSTASDTLESDPPPEMPLPE